MTAKSSNALRTHQPPMDSKTKSHQEKIVAASTQSPANVSVRCTPTLSSTPPQARKKSSSSTPASPAGTSLINDTALNRAYVMLTKDSVQSPSVQVAVTSSQTELDETPNISRRRNQFNLTDSHVVDEKQNLVGSVVQEANPGSRELGQTVLAFALVAAIGKIH
ncbi:hypothetical protein HK102_011907 [Quaeritorhiza haematococci]|nr:hypothetical protein HK102_011907 [Quaeritorhiza haematococci]